MAYATAAEKLDLNPGLMTGMLHQITADADPS